MPALNVKITRQPMVEGASQISWNVDRNGVPFGQIWTFRDALDDAGYVYVFSAKTLRGDFATFDTYEEASAFMMEKAA